MSVFSRYQIIVEEKAEEIVQDIYTTMLANAPVYTGAVMRSIHIERRGKYSWFIAPDTDHDWYAENGNRANNPDGYIHPVKAKALVFTDRYGNKVVTSRVKPHKGSKFIKKTADKYR